MFISAEADQRYREVSRNEFNHTLSHRDLERITLEKTGKKDIKKQGEQYQSQNKPHKSKIPNILKRSPKERGEG